MAYSPARVPEGDHYMLRCCIKMRQGELGRVLIRLLPHAPCKASGESAWQEDEHHSPSSAFQQATPDLIGRNSPQKCHTAYGWRT
jgi:hypothetical protein